MVVIHILDREDEQYIIIQHHHIKVCQFLLEYRQDMEVVLLDHVLKQMHVFKDKMALRDVLE